MRPTVGFPLYRFEGLLMTDRNDPLNGRIGSNFRCHHAPRRGQPLEMP